MGAERDRVAEFGKLENGLRQAGDWYRWGPYISERQWGTVREDYSADGDAWNYLPHDQARSRAYRWGEDGLAGFCDVEQRLCQTGQRPASDLVLKFLEHFAAIRDALASQGLWDNTDGFYYDRLVTPSGHQVPIKVRSMVGMIPVLATAVITESDLRQALILGKQFADLLGREDLVDIGAMRERGTLHEMGGEQWLLLSLDDPDRLTRLQSDPAWRDNVVLGEYFNGDTAAALGASHQADWTGVVADIIRRRYGLVRSVGEVVMPVAQQSRT